MDTAPPLRVVLHDRGAMAVLATVFASTTASVIQATALGKLVFDMTGEALDLGLLGLAEFLPAFVLVLVTGSVADRFDRRRIVALGLSVEFVCAIALAWYATTNPVVAGADLRHRRRVRGGPGLRRPGGPGDAGRRRDARRVPAAGGAELGLVAGGADRRAGRRRLPLRRLAGLAVPGRLGPASWWPSSPSGSCGSAPAWAAAGTPTASAPERPTLHEAFEGLRFIRRTPILLGAISLDLFAVLFGGAVALLPAIAEDRLGVGAVGLGWLRAAAGIGAALMGVTLALRPLRRHVGSILLVVVGLFGVFTVVLGLTRSFAVAFVALMVLSAADAVSVFIRSTLVPLVTPDASRGRVLAVENVFIGASNELGAAESGVAGQLLGIAGAVTLGGVATLVIAGLWAVAVPGPAEGRPLLRRDGRAGVTGAAVRDDGGRHAGHGLAVGVGGARHGRVAYVGRGAGGAGCCWVMQWTPPP